MDFLASYISLFLSSFVQVSLLVSKLLCLSRCALGRNLFFRYNSFQDPLCLPFVSVLVPLVVSNLFPFHLLLFNAVLLSGHFWDAKFSLFSICFRASPLVTSYLLPWLYLPYYFLSGLIAKDSSCLPSVSLHVSLPVPNFSPYFSISIAILSLGAFGHRNLPVSHALTSLSMALCSSFWWLWERLSPCLSPLFSPTCALTLPLQLVPLLFFLSLSLSLSLAVLLSGCFCGHILSSPSICFHTCLPCSLQVVSLTFSPLLFFSQSAFWKSEFPGLRSSLTCCACLCSACFGTKPIVRYIPLASVSPLSLLTFRLVSNLSPYPLSTIVLLSGSPAFGTERKAFLLFPFFPYLFL